MADPRQPSFVPPRRWLIAMLCLLVAGAKVMASDCGCANHANSAHVLSLSAPTLDQPIGPDLASPSRQAFVEIAVTKVINPERIPISFVVYFHSAEGKKSYLGNFSLFPPDNPGKFIVATHGKLETGGRVSITLVPLQSVSTTPFICTRIGPIKFIKQK